MGVPCNPVSSCVFVPILVDIQYRCNKIVVGLGVSICIVVRISRNAWPP